MGWPRRAKEMQVEREAEENPASKRRASPVSSNAARSKEF
jgi:hypothetical protein